MFYRRFSFLLLLRLAVELKKGEGGWVNIFSLYDEHIIADPGKYQIYSNLRTVLKGSLIVKNAEKFVENDGSKNYRISTHPDFITYNKEKLLNHQDSQIRKLACIFRKDPDTVSGNFRNMQCLKTLIKNRNVI